MNRSAPSSSDPEPLRWGWAPLVLAGRAPGSPGNPSSSHAACLGGCRSPTVLGRGGGGKGEQRVSEQRPSGREGGEGRPERTPPPRGRERERRAKDSPPGPLPRGGQTDRQTGSLVWEGDRSEAGPGSWLWPRDFDGTEPRAKAGVAAPRWLRGAGRGEPPARSGPVRGPAGVQQARPAGVCQEPPSGCQGSRRRMSPPAQRSPGHGPPPPPAAQPHVSESAGAIGELGLQTTTPCILSLFPPTDLSPLSCQAKYFGLAGRAERAGGPRKPIRLALGRGGRGLGAAPVRPEIARVSAATCRSSRPGARRPRGSGPLSRAGPCRSPGRAPPASVRLLLRVSRPPGLPFARTLRALLPPEASPHLLCCSLRLRPHLPVPWFRLSLCLWLGHRLLSVAGCGCLCVPMALIPSPAISVWIPPRWVPTLPSPLKPASLCPLGLARPFFFPEPSAEARTGHEAGLGQWQYPGWARG